MSKISAIFSEMESELEQQQKNLLELKALMSDTSELDAIFERKVIYKEPRQIVITVVAFDNQYFKKILKVHLWKKFPSVARQFGDAVTVVGPADQFSEQEKSILKKYGLRIWSRDTTSTFPCPN